MRRRSLCRIRNLNDRPQTIAGCRFARVPQPSALYVYVGRGRAAIHGNPRPYPCLPGPTLPATARSEFLSYGTNSDFAIGCSSPATAAELSANLLRVSTKRSGLLPVLSRGKRYDKKGRQHIMAVLDWSQCPAVESVPGRRSGAWVFRDTRMPVATVFENLEDGSSIEEIIEQFHVTREQIQDVLEFAARSLDAPPVSVGSDTLVDAHTL
jgi:uncharacterized protein (DUF433 family)